MLEIDVRHLPCTSIRTEKCKAEVPKNQFMNPKAFNFLILCNLSAIQILLILSLCIGLMRKLIF